VLTLAAAGSARPDDKKVVVPGDPVLTQDMLDDYGKLADWRFGSILGQIGGADRLRQMIVNDWTNGDIKRQRAVLADLKWWREEFPKLTADQRGRLAAPAPPAGQPAPDANSIHMLKLQRWFDAQQIQIRALGNLQAKHHELMMIIINNMRPTGRYEYNPSTGRYDRYVP
jgi:hypothetical protein